MTGKTEKIRKDLLEVIDDPVSLHRRIEFWLRDEPIRMEMILDGVSIK